jgi:hypothetical protein
MTDQRRYFTRANFAHKLLGSLAGETAELFDANDAEVRAWLERLDAARTALANLAERAEG